MAHACNSNTEEQFKGTASSVFESEALSKRIIFWEHYELSLGYLSVIYKIQMIQMNFVFTCGSHCCHNSLCICSESEKYLKPQTFLVANASNQRLFTRTRLRTSEAPPAKHGSGDRAKRLCLSLPGFPFYNGRSHLKEITATPGWGIVFKVYTDSPLRKTEQVSQNSNFHIFRYPRSELETMVGREQELPSAIHEGIL